jgi:hypothetical protein|tara:strand:- start:54 stop:533 length:480 start_codon:yes stop_codon:yes gene_type:complete
MMNKEITMIGLEVTGGVEKDRELAEEIVWWCMDMLMPRHRVLDITVELTETYEQGATGFCYQGDDDRDFFIDIDHRLSRAVGREEFIECVMHEMVHVWQGATGRMKDRFVGGYKKFWKCKDGKYRNYSNTTYEKQPWEVEAYKMQGPLTKTFMKEYGYV